MIFVLIFMVMILISCSLYISLKNENEKEMKRLDSFCVYKNANAKSIFTMRIQTKTRTLVWLIRLIDRSQYIIFSVVFLQHSSCCLGLKAVKHGSRGGWMQSISCGFTYIPELDEWRETKGKLTYHWWHILKIVNMEYFIVIVTSSLSSVYIL